ncbi:MAG TPA: hypothetical protein VKE98_01920 [Gemmataceae bacterium]|nr:hypothetical protein [Gemmataceae bacterium]
MHKKFGWAWLCAGLASIGLVTMVSAGGVGGPTDLGEKKVEKFRKLRPTTEWSLLVKGGRQVEEGDKRNIRLAAEVLVWQTTWRTNPKKPDDVRKEFEQEMGTLLNKENRDKNKDFRKHFAKELVACFKEVFALPFDENKLGCQNAAILLPSLARLQEEEIGDLLTDLIRDPKQHDAVKLYALKGLAAYFPAYEWTVVAPKDNSGNVIPDARKKKYIERIQVLIDFLDRTWESNKADDDAIRFLRREAIRTLAQAQVPAVEVTKDKVFAPVAQRLVQILDPKTKMTPSPSLQEKVEAAIGICQIKVIPNTLYLPDEGIYRVGTFLVEFANAYKNDRTDFVGGGKFRKIPKIPWKIESERLLQALKLQVKNNEIKNAKVLQDAAQPYLSPMKTHAELDRNPKELGVEVDSMRKTPQIYNIKPADNDK